jgi:hypothetical protein
MNSADILIILAVTGMMFGFIRFAYELGYREGHSEGYLRGRAIAQALKDKGLVR